MKYKMSKLLAVCVLLSLIAGSIMTACTPAATATPEKPAAEQETKAVVNRAGVTLPADAAPIEEQVMTYAIDEYKWLTYDASAYDANDGVSFFGDTCTRANKEYEIIPNACESWEISEDGLTWTFHLPKDKIWTDDTPITANDWVFTLQHLARPDYDFEWYYGEAHIVNWSAVVSGEKAPEELGAKVVDDYTFTVTTDRPTPYLIKLFSNLMVNPKHIVKDVRDDGSWALNEANWVFSGAYRLEKWEKGKEMVWVANEKYTGPFPPLHDKIINKVMDVQTRWAAYQNGELDAIGGGYQADLPTSAMAEIMSNPELQKELIQWPSFTTFYLFFDTWNEPFNNLKVRQAFSHAIDRDKLINGPLQYQATAGYTMNPPSFPGESVEALKGLSNYDPALAARLMEEAGYPGGKDFPKLTLYTRKADAALSNAAQAVAGMLAENLGVTIEIQNLDYSMYMEKMSQQKQNKGGDMLFALVAYEFDYVDGGNMLGVWGGCEEPGVTDMSEMPGRHTWYNADYNKLVCEAGSIVGDEGKRNEMYRQAEKILIEDVAMISLYHPLLVAMVKPYIKGEMFAPSKTGAVTWERNSLSARDSLIYHSKSNR